MTDDDDDKLMMVIMTTLKGLKSTPLKYHMIQI